jgi:multiple sugar transport system ATP-binding protein
MNLVPPETLGLDARPGIEAGVRPEHLLLDADGVPAVVTLVEPAGGEAFVRLRAGAHQLVARVDADARPSPGDEVRLRAARVHYFDAATGRRLP